MKDILYIVIPCYNEEEVLPETSKQLKAKLEKLISNNKISKKSKILFIDDGSKDSTWNLIKKLCKEYHSFSGIKLSRNRGHQNALLAGLMEANKVADITISMDADLQDDINVIDSMIEEYNKGNQIVYGVRSSRKKDSFFKRTTAQLFYKLMKILGVEIIYNHADCRLMSKKALKGLEQFEEVNLFLRGIVPLIGFQSSIVYYERNKRTAGVSKYPLKKMITFACEGITSFSIKPLRLVFSIGIFLFIVSFMIMFYALVQKILGNVVEGWTFLTISIWMIGSFQMISIGVLGEYIGKIYYETKKRPKYILDEVLDDEINSKNE